MKNTEPKIDQLENLEIACHHIIAEEPQRKALSNDEIARGTGVIVKNIDKRLRDGIIFYSSGWGWRLRIGWEDVLKARYAEVSE